MPLTVRQSTLKDVKYLAANLRVADRREIEAGSGEDPELVLRHGLESPDGCWVAVDIEDTPAIIMGTYPTDQPGVGLIWMMATDELLVHWRQVLRETHWRLDRLFGSKYECLSNVAHSDNSIHLKWLKWAGFEFYEPIKINGDYFTPFAKRKTKHV